MSLGIIYIGMLAVSLVCGFISRKNSNSKLTMVVGILMLAACVYVALKVSWWHIMGIIGVTLVGLNVFGALEMINRSKKAEKERIDKIFNVDDDK